MQLPLPVSPAIHLAELVASLYCNAQRTLTVSEPSARVLDNLFDAIVDLEVIAASELGPNARRVLGQAP